MKDELTKVSKASDIKAPHLKGKVRKEAKAATYTSSSQDAEPQAVSVPK